MKDPFYAQLLLQVENLICQADADAKSKGLQLSDSQVRSALVRTRKKLKGEKPLIPQTNEREIILAKLIDSLLLAREYIIRKSITADAQEISIPLSAADWSKALGTVEVSVMTRKSDTPGSRHYLDYVHEFVKKAKSLG